MLDSCWGQNSPPKLNVQIQSSISHSALSPNLIAPHIIGLVCSSSFLSESRWRRTCYRASEQEKPLQPEPLPMCAQCKKMLWVCQSQAQQSWKEGEGKSRTPPTQLTRILGRVRYYTVELPVPICDVPQYNSHQFWKEFYNKNSATLIISKPWFKADGQKMFRVVGLHPNPRELSAGPLLLCSACCLLQSSAQGGNAAIGFSFMLI